jgi:hypothetical protein
MDKFANGKIPTNTNEAVVLFYEKILATDGQRFMPIDAVNFVQQYNFGTTQGTIERALRNLRSKNKINYTVVNRRLGILQALATVSPSVQDIVKAAEENSR